MTKPSLGASSTAKDTTNKESTANSQGLWNLDQVYEGAPHDQVPQYENLTDLYSGLSRHKNSLINQLACNTPQE